MIRKPLQLFGQFIPWAQCTYNKRAIPKDGKEYKATGIFADEDTFEADMAKAYGMDELLSLVRKCEITETTLK